MALPSKAPEPAPFMKVTPWRLRWKKITDERVKLGECIRMPRGIPYAQSVRTLQKQQCVTSCDPGTTCNRKPTAVKIRTEVWVEGRAGGYAFCRVILQSRHVLSRELFMVQT